MPNTRQILIVDDDPELREALSEQLSLYEEFKAFAAEDGRKGVQAAKAGQIDLVTMTANPKNMRVQSRLEKTARENALTVSYEAQAKIVREKIARLKALRLAKEASERKNSDA